MVVKTTKDTEIDSRRSIDGAVLFWIHQAEHSVRHEILRHFRDSGRDLSTATWEVLASLWQRDGQTQSEIARSTGRDKAGLTRLIDRMSKNTWVERQPDPEDRRVVRVYLTARGRRLHGELLPAVSAAIETALEGIGDEDKSVLRKSLKQVCVNLDKKRDTR